MFSASIFNCIPWIYLRTQSCYRRCMFSVRTKSLTRYICWCQGSSVPSASRTPWRRLSLESVPGWWHLWSVFGVSPLVARGLPLTPTKECPTRICPPICTKKKVNRKLKICLPVHLVWNFHFTNRILCFMISYPTFSSCGTFCVEPMALSNSPTNMVSKLFRFVL